MVFVDKNKKLRILWCYNNTTKNWFERFDSLLSFFFNTTPPSPIHDKLISIIKKQVGQGLYREIRWAGHGNQSRLKYAHSDYVGA